MIRSRFEPELRLRRTRVQTGEETVMKKDQRMELVDHNATRSQSLDEALDCNRL